MRGLLICTLLVGLLSLGMWRGADAQTAPDDPTTVQQGVYQAPLTGPPSANPGTTLVGSGLPAGAGGRSQPLIAVDSTAQSSPFNGPFPFATAQCRDAWFSFSQMREGTCAGHGGVLLWIIEPGTACSVLASRIQQGMAHPDPVCSGGHPTVSPVGPAS